VLRLGEPGLGISDVLLPEPAIQVLENAVRPGELALHTRELPAPQTLADPAEQARAFGPCTRQRLCASGHGTGRSGRREGASAAGWIGLAAQRLGEDGENTTEDRCSIMVLHRVHSHSPAGLCDTVAVVPMVRRTMAR